MILFIFGIVCALIGGWGIGYNMGVTDTRKEINKTVEAYYEKRKSEEI